MRLYRKKTVDPNDARQLQNLATREIEQSMSFQLDRPPSERVFFQSIHPQATSHLNIKRSKPIVHVLVGPQIPQRDREDSKERYYRAIMTLFIPWRSVLDLCDINHTWEQAFTVRQENITFDSQKIIENIQLFHECKNNRDEHLKQVIEAAQIETIDPQYYPNEIDDYDGTDGEEILNILQSIDTDYLSSSKDMFGVGPEEHYYIKIVQNVERTGRFINIESRILLLIFSTNVFYFLRRFQYHIGQEFGLQTSIKQGDKRSSKLSSPHYFKAKSVKQ